MASRPFENHCIILRFVFVLFLQLELLANKPSEDFVFTEPNYELLKNLTNDVSNN